VRGDGTSVRVSFPPLTSERRTQLLKLAGERVEEARISVRKERERVIKEIDAAEKSGTLTEDATRRSKTELQKLVDASNAKFEEMRKKKEAELAA
jgi:ribosome recycling factor